MTALLRTQGISKAFGGVQALSDCSIEVEQGSITGLIGPNGSGKTTLFNVITGYERPDAGQVYFADRDITGASAHRVFAGGIGRTFQLTRIFPRLTVLENMLIAGQHAGSRAQQAATLDAKPERSAVRGLVVDVTTGRTLAPGQYMAPAAHSGLARRAGTHRVRNPLARAGGAADRRRAMELLDFTGIAGHATALAGTLSYGQRKLLEMAYVMVADPAIVLLDEPAGGINPSLIHIIADRIRELNAAGKTFLIVEHNMEFVMDLCGHIAVLDYGTVVASGPPQAIRDDPKVLDAYLGVAEDDDEPVG